MVDIETLDKTDTENLDISKMDKGDTLPEDKVEEKTEAPAEEKTEAPAEETPEETGEEKDSAKAEGKPDQERDDKGRFKEIKVPKNRFDQERLAKEAAEKRAEELERQLTQVQQRAEVSKDRAEQASLLDEKISELEGQYGKLMIDGDAEKAAAVMKEIRTLNRQVARLESQEESTSVVSQQIEAQRLETTIARLEADNPVLNPKSDAYDDDIVQMIILVQRNLVQNGLPPSHAMAQATERVLGKLNASGQSRAEKEGLGKAEADAAAARDDRSKKAVEKSLATQNAQPSTMRDAGMDSDKLGKTGLPDVGKLTVEEYAALPESTRARLRGDYL